MYPLDLVGDSDISWHDDMPGGGEEIYTLGRYSGTLTDEHTFPSAHIDQVFKDGPCHAWTPPAQSRRF